MRSSAVSTPSRPGTATAVSALLASKIAVIRSVRCTGSAPITGEAILAAAPDVIVVPASGLESVGGDPVGDEVIPHALGPPA